MSFELAAKRLGADVVNLEVQLSSRVKGESMLDTVFTLEALHVDVLVIREAEAGVLGLVANHVAPHVSVLSAGEAHISHPTQGLLDALTVRQYKRRFDELSIAIVGDIQHSRVARSAYQAFRTLGVPDLRIVAPPAFMPKAEEFAGCSRHATLKAGLKDVDVVMMLRIQKERMTHASLPDADRYFRKYGLTPERLARGEARCHRDAPAADEPRHRDRLGRRGRSAVGDPRSGAQRRGRAHGGARDRDGAGYGG